MECGNMLKFADDTKLFCKVSSDINCAKLRADLRKLHNWSEEWQMLFNLYKYKIMHFGYNNLNNIFILGGHILETADEGKDFGVMIRKDLKASSQCVKIVKTANQIVGMIKRTFIFKSKDNLLQLYKCLDRPHMMYCMQVQNPYLKKEIDLLEGVQRRATKMILAYEHYGYEDRLALCQLSTLDGRRLRGDLIQAFKLLKGLDQITYNNFFVLDGNKSTRGHTLKVAKPRARLDIRLNSFSHRVINCWNNRPVEIVECRSLNIKQRVLVYSDLL